MTAREVARTLGLKPAGGAHRGACPACGYPAAFTLTVRDGRALGWCASCGDQPAIGAALRAAGMGEAVCSPVSRPDQVPGHTAAQEAARARRKERALALWAGSAPVPGKPAATYLAARHLAHLAACADLRFRADCPHPGGGCLPALVALIRDGDGAPAAIHRTYLRPDGRAKAAVTPAKATLAPVWGNAVRLAAPAPAMAIGEGIETSAAAGVLTGLPAWSAINAGNLARGLALPAIVRCVTIAVDRDPPGERAAATAAARWRAEGRTVRFLWPEAPGQDAADLLATREAPHA